MPKILIIHPYDRTTLFLNRITSRLQNELGRDLHCFKVKPNLESHRLVRDRIENGDEKFIVFLSHGTSESIWGAIGDAARSNATISHNSHENPDLFEERHLITFATLTSLRGKKVFCLTCRSAEKIAPEAVRLHSKVFIGFGDIPTDEPEERTATGEERREIARFKSILNQIIKESLVLAIKENMSFEQLAMLIKIHVHKQIYNLIKYHPREKNKQKIARNLIRFKNEMKIFGDASLKLITD